jgi:ribosomal protein S18 acetylase RimI-like enzyme
MEIRRAGGGDVDAIRRVAERSWEYDYPDILTRETITEGVAEWYGTEHVRADLGNPDATILVAERAGEVVGFVQGHTAENVGTVLRLYVDPDHRREGVASALFAAVTDELEREDVDRIRAMALAANEQGCAFYRSQGLKRVATDTTIIDGDRYDEAIFERRENT